MNDHPVWMSLPAPSTHLAALGASLMRELDEFVDRLTAAMIEGIPGLPTDDPMRTLLRSSVRGNVETSAQIYAGKLSLEAIQAPPDAIEYARRLAQREAPPTALVRAYRWGQFMSMEWAMTEFAALIPDPKAQVAAIREFAALNFWYIDRISEVVVAEYQAERERWLAHRGTVRGTTLRSLLAGEHVDPRDAEHALGYRLDQPHLAAVVWTDESRDGTDDLAHLEAAAHLLASSVSGTGPYLLWSYDPTTAWIWVPWNPRRAPDPGALSAAITHAEPGVHIALGSPGQNIDGFRQTHLDALLAERVARVSGDAAPGLISITDPGVRAAALMTTDLDAVRRLVASTLGDLAVDTATATGLRETLRAYLEEGGSHVAVAERLHVHKNTVGYRLGKALEICGKPLDGNRVDFELALIACQWLSPAVLVR